MRAKKSRSDQSAGLEVILRPDAPPAVRVPQPRELADNRGGNRNELAVCEYCSSIQPTLTEIVRLIQELRRLPEELRAIMNISKEWFTTEEFAKAAKKKPWTIRARCNQGRLNAVKVNGRGRCGEWRLSHEELLRFQREGYLDA